VGHLNSPPRAIKLAEWTEPDRSVQIGRWSKAHTTCSVSATMAVAMHPGHLQRFLQGLEDEKFPGALDALRHGSISWNPGFQTAVG